jgi:hypothetical protein
MVERVLLFDIAGKGELSSRFWCHGYDAQDRKGKEKKLMRWERGIGGGFKK